MLNHKQRRRRANTIPPCYEVAIGKSLKNSLSRFTNEMTYCVQVTDREALMGLKGGLDKLSLLDRCA